MTTLSDKIRYFNSNQYCFIEEDVKEFIKQLKDTIDEEYYKETDFDPLIIRAIIDTLAGEKLICPNKSEETSMLVDTTSSRKNNLIIEVNTTQQKPITSGQAQTGSDTPKYIRDTLFCTTGELDKAIEEAKR